MNNAERAYRRAMRDADALREYNRRRKEDWRGIMLVFIAAAAAVASALMEAIF